MAKTDQIQEQSPDENNSWTSLLMSIDWSSWPSYLGIIAITAVSAYVGTKTCNSDQSEVLSRSIIAGSLGFFGATAIHYASQNTRDTSLAGLMKTQNELIKVIDRQPTTPEDSASKRIKDIEQQFAGIVKNYPEIEKNLADLGELIARRCKELGANTVLTNEKRMSVLKNTYTYLLRLSLELDLSAVDEEKAKHVSEAMKFWSAEEHTLSEQLEQLNPSEDSLQESQLNTL